jgi:hypothetical protein
MLAPKKLWQTLKNFDYPKKPAEAGRFEMSSLSPWLCVNYSAINGRASNTPAAASAALGVFSFFLPDRVTYYRTVTCVLP